MNSALDTSFIIRLLTGDPPDQAARAQAMLERCIERGQPPLVTDLVVVEAYFALQSHYQVPQGRSIGSLTASTAKRRRKTGGLCTGNHEEHSQSGYGETRLCRPHHPR